MALTPSSSHPRGLPLGLPGAISPTRYVGGTAAVAPTTGTFAVGDFVVTADAKIFACTVAGTPGTWVQVGGSAPPTSRAQYRGNSTAIANGDAGQLPWNTKLSGSALLDLSTPAAPTMVTAGIYAVTCQVTASAPPTAGGFYRLSLELDADNDDPSVNVNFWPNEGAITMTWYFPAGGKIIATVTNNDGVVSRDFLVTNGDIQRIT